MVRNTFISLQESQRTGSVHQVSFWS